MSLKIFNTYLWDKDLGSLITYLNNIKSKYVDILVNGCFSEHFRRNYITTLSRQDLCTRIKEDSRSAFNGMIFDCSAEFVVYQFDNKIVIHFFGNDEIIKSLNLPLESFDYYEGDDFNSGCIESYKSRGKWWYSLMDNYKSQTPTRMGLVYNIWDEYMSNDIAEKLKDKFK